MFGCNLIREKGGGGGWVIKGPKSHTPSWFFAIKWKLFLGIAASFKLPQTRHPYQGEPSIKFEDVLI